MELSEFKHKAVSGLYSFDHFEAENGAFIQRRHDGSLFVFQGPSGERRDFNSIEALKDHLKRL